MNKCSKCGNEYEGKFCPECGTPCAQEKTCPKCGTTVKASARFCNECGYAFDGETRQSAPESNSAHTTVQPVQSAPSPAPPAPVPAPVAPRDNTAFYSKLHHALSYVPTVAILLFAALLFGLFAAPIAVMPVGELMEGVKLKPLSYGNVYADFIANVSELKGEVIAMLVFACGAAVFALCMLIYLFLPYARYDKRKQTVLGIISQVFYLVFIILSSVILVRIKKLDAGTGLIKASACPKLVLSFATVFFALSCGSIAARRIMASKNPEFVNAERRRFEEVLNAARARIEEYKQTHTPPVAPRVGEFYYKKRWAVYKYQKRRYDCGKSWNASAGAVWLYCNRIWLSILAAIIIAASVLIAILVPALSNIFRIGKVQKVEIGYTPEQVLEILGEPCEYTKTDATWQYFDKKYMKLVKKLEDNVAEQEKAVESGDLDKLNGLLSSYEGLESQLKNTTHDYIEVNFASEHTEDGDTLYFVAEVLLDKARNDSVEEASTEKKVKKVSIDSDGYYMNEHDGGKRNVLMSTKSGASGYTVKFADGDLYRAKLNESAYEISDDTVTAKWSDRYGEYTVEKDVICIGRVDENGKWHTNNETKILALPYGVTGIYQLGHYGERVKLRTLIIPGSVKTVGELSHDRLKKVILQEGVKEVKSDAFKYCEKLRKISVPDSIEKFEVRIADINIKLNKYEGAKYLGNAKNPYVILVEANKSKKSVTINEQTKIILKEAFRECYDIKSITIPDSVVEIGSQAFVSCTGLKSVTIGSGVTRIGDWAFGGCANISRIDFSGTVGQWNAISKTPSWKPTSRDYTIYCLDGTVTESGEWLEW